MDEVQVTDVQAAPDNVAVDTPEVAVQNEVIQDAPAEADKAPVVQEKMIPQSQVNKIAAREAKQAAERTRHEMQAEYERQRVSQEVQQAPSQMGGMPQFSPEQMEQHIMAAAHRMSAKMTADKMAADFESKIKAEIESDPDFGDVYDSLNIVQHPELVIWMNGMDNSAKVVKDLANNPAKFANILMLAKNGMGTLAQRELTKLSDSIKVNQEAQAQPKVKEPLDQLSPSSIGTGSGEMSVSDFMKMDWLRG
jgi:uncharacterized OsmC-like protein